MRVPDTSSDHGLAGWMGANHSLEGERLSSAGFPQTNDDPVALVQRRDSDNQGATSGRATVVHHPRRAPAPDVYRPLEAGDHYRSRRTSDAARSPRNARLSVKRTHKRSSSPPRHRSDGITGASLELSQSRRRPPHKRRRTSRGWQPSPPVESPCSPLESRDGEASRLMNEFQNVTWRKPAVPAAPILKLTTEVNGVKDVPTGPSHHRQRLGIAVAKRLPHLFIAHEYLPAESWKQPHLRKMIERNSPQDILMDDTGWYITFIDSAQGRMSLTMCAKRCQNKVMFGEYRLQVQVSDGVMGSNDTNRQTSVTGSTRTEHVIDDDTAVHSSSERAPVAVGIDHEPREQFKPRERSYVIALPNSRADKDDTASSLSGLSSGASSRCHVCRVRSDSLIKCTTCSRRYHRPCHPNKTIPADENLADWQCQRCVRKSIPPKRLSPGVPAIFERRQSVPVDLSNDGVPAQDKLKDTLPDIHEQPRPAVRVTDNEAVEADDLIERSFNMTEPAMRDQSEAGPKKPGFVRTKLPTMSQAREDDVQSSLVARRPDSVESAADHGAASPVDSVVQAPARSRRSLQSKSVKCTQCRNRKVPRHPSGVSICMKCRGEAEEVKDVAASVPVGESISSGLSKRSTAELPGPAAADTTAQRNESFSPQDQPAEQEVAHSASGPSKNAFDSSARPAAKMKASSQLPVEAPPSTIEQVSSGTKHFPTISDKPHPHPIAESPGEINTGPVASPRTVRANSLASNEVVVPAIASERSKEFQANAQSGEVRCSGETICDNCTQNRKTCVYTSTERQPEAVASLSTMNSASDEFLALISQPQDDDSQLEDEASEVGGYVKSPVPRPERKKYKKTNHRDVAQKSPPLTPVKRQPSVKRQSHRSNAKDEFDLGDSHTRPKGTFIRLMALALCEAPSKRLQASDAPKWVAANVPNYCLKEGGWAGSLKATMILNVKGSSGLPIARRIPWRESDGGRDSSDWYELLPNIERRLEHWDYTLKRPIPPVEGAYNSTKHQDESIDTESPSTKSQDADSNADYEVMDVVATPEPVEEDASDHEPLALRKKRTLQSGTLVAPLLNADSPAQAPEDEMVIDTASPPIHQTQQVVGGDFHEKRFPVRPYVQNEADVASRERDEAYMLYLVNDLTKSTQSRKTTFHDIWPEYQTGSGLDWNAIAQPIRVRPNRRKRFSKPLGLSQQLQHVPGSSTTSLVVEPVSTNAGPEDATLTIPCSSLDDFFDIKEPQPLVPVLAGKQLAFRSGDSRSRKVYKLDI